MEKMNKKQFIASMVELFGEYKPAMLKEVSNYIKNLSEKELAELKDQIVLNYEDKFRIPPCVAAIKTILDKNKSLDSKTVNSKYITI